MNDVVSFVVAALGVYMLAGVLVAIYAVSGALRRFDPATQESRLGFKVVAFPGLAALWPVVLLKIMAAKPRSSASSRQRVAVSLRTQQIAWLVIGPLACGVLALGVFG